MTDERGQAQGPEHKVRTRLPLVVAIGASAGGPRALLTLLAGLDLPGPAFAFLVQHIHPKFTRILLRRLGEVSSLPVLEAQDGETAQPGQIYLAPSGHHLVVERTWPRTCRTLLTDDPPRHGVRPSVDELFISAAAAFGPRTIGVVLTGMGRDGLDGARAIKARGGTVLAEAEATCTVYGMPRALAEAGLADRLVPINEMGAAIRQACLEAVEAASSVLLPSPD